MNLIKLFLLTLALMCNVLLQASQEFDHLPNAVKATLEKCSNKIDLEGEANSIVGGCVSVITGRFVEKELDLVVPGSTPFEITRSGCIGGQYNSPDYLENLRLNCYDSVYAKCEKLLIDVEVTNWEDRGGSILYLFSKQGTKKKMEIPFFEQQVGFSNTMDGVISGRTNRLNNLARLDGKTKDLNILTSYGSLKLFRFDLEPNHYKLDTEYFMSGLQTKYSYTHGHTQLKNKTYLTTKKALLNMAGQEMGSVHLELLSYKQLAKQKIIHVTASNNTSVGYEFTEDFPGVDREDFRLVKVHKPHGIEVTYEWEKESRTPHKKRWPDGRYIHISTYKLGKSLVAGESIEILKPQEDPRWQRVKFIAGPVGVDQQGHKTYEFIYHAKKKDNELRTTDVYDRYGNKTVYAYNRNLQLVSVTPMRNGSPYVVDKAFWGSMNLYRRSIEDGKRILVCTDYNYDGKHNPIEISYIGNLTGRTDLTITVDKNNKLIDNGYERHSVKSKYSPDTRCLKIEENDGQKIIRFDYGENKDLLNAKYICDLNGTIRERFFYEYDVNAAVILEIHDDGSTTNVADLTDVTMRHIKRITTSQQIPFGYPLETRNYYLDLATGAESFISHEKKSYDLQGNVLQTQLLDADGTVIADQILTYDNRSNVLTETDVLGRQTIRQYDANNNLTYEKKPGVPPTTREYDFSNRLIAVKIHLNNDQVLTEKYRYDPLSRKIEDINPQGEATHYEYDFLGRLVKSTQPNGEASTIAYNKLSQPIEIVDAQARKLKITYNCRHKPIKMEYPNGTSEQWFYTIEGLLEEHIGISGIRTLYEYDFCSRCTKQSIYPAGNNEPPLIHTWVYNTFHLLSESDPSGNTTNYSYDGAGRLIAKEINGVKLHYEYTTSGLLARTVESTEEGIQSAVSNKYDLANRLIEQSEENSEGATIKQTLFTYDDCDRIVQTVTNSDGITRVETQKYGPLGESQGFVDVEGNEIRKISDYLYRDENGRTVRREQTIDPQGNILEAHYDGNGNILRTKLFNSLNVLLKEEINQFDSSGNRLQLEEWITVNGENKRQVLTHWEYDWFNRLQSRTDAVGTVEQKRAEISYNNYGQKESITKPDGAQIRYTYDGFGRLSQVKSSDNTIGYRLIYDERSRIVRIDEKDKSTLRDYNERNDLIGETLSNGLRVGYTYDVKGRPTSLQLPDGSYVMYQYDAQNLLKIERYDNHDNLRYTHEYLSYNVDNQPLLMRMPGQSGTVTAQYDIHGRTVSIGHPLWNETIPKEGYDNVGNLKMLNINDAHGAKTYQYDYNAQKQLTKEDDHEYQWDSQYNCVLKDGVEQEHNALNQLLTDGTESYKYDLNGNLLGKGDVSFAYDTLDRLIKVESPLQKFEYDYDFQNRRVAKRRFHLENEEWRLDNTERYLYTGDQEIGACNESGEIFQLRILGIGLGAEIGASVAIELEGKTYAPIHNHIGHIVTLVDIDSGEASATYRYSAFGHELTENEIANPWRFASKRKDTETGFYNFGRRYYSPDLMRWLTPDPIDRNGGPNIYAYVLNAPMSNFDLYGLHPMAQLVDKSSFAQPTAIQRLKSDMRAHSASTNIGSIVLTVLEAMKSTVSTVITGAIQVGFGIGKIIGNLYHPTHEFSTTREGYDRALGWKSPLLRVISFNGICNSFEDAHKTAQNISALGENIEVEAWSMRTNGFIWDILEVIVLKLGFKTSNVYKTYEALQEALEKDPEGYLVLIAHSKGTEVLYQAMKMLSAEQRQRIFYAGFGGARMVEEGFCKQVDNFVSRNDCVPLIGDTFAHFQPDKYNIKYLDSSGPILFDHSMSCETYELELLNYQRAIMKIHRKLL